MEATTREIVEEILHPQNPGYSEEHQLDRLVISVPEIEVTLPQHVSLQDEEEIKQILWETQREAILQSMILHPKGHKTELEKAKQRLLLLDQISEVQRQFLQKKEVRLFILCLCCFLSV